MSTQTGQQSDFGANEWYIQELYQDYLKDPASVPETWRAFLADYQPVTAPPATNGGAAAPAPAPAVPAAAPAPSAPAAPTPAAAPAAAAPATKPTAAPAEPAPAEDAEAEPVRTPLKGAAARVVANMEASLEIPTATSVRAVPAKLLADNRTVINNHLRRARGGKVSFTHLIGYALVKAVADVPVMNASFAEVDGKPQVVMPPHVGLGLAIDLQNPNGTRSLVVAAIKKADTLDFAQFHAAYEDIVRRARNGKLT
ncbi:MAG TPA: 2-oxo acid dehydrogenase subunit E2, partial [Mycobacteriales bacterium]|nr:2-oxo acid dehydrogenase subunit E2 [Mycobacteriales bacterium]